MAYCNAAICPELSEQRKSPAHARHDVIDRVARVSPVHTAMRNCTRDGGGPFEVGNQVLISNHCKLLSSKAMVVSVAANVGSYPSQEEPVDKAKPFNIPKREVWEAFKKVKANQGAAGVDGQTIADFEADLTNNLYKLWNWLSSGSYFPPPVRRVDIPKGDGGTRPLGIPTVADRVAQEVARRYLEPCLEPAFHADSYGYRPGKSAIDAVRQARQRCWRYDWVLDLDVKGYFDSIDWELMLKAVRRHTNCPWVLLYIERWLKAPVQMEDGSIVPRVGNASRRGHKPHPGKFVSALCVRHVDGEKVSSHPVRALRG